ncbi:MAG: ATP-grasp fold amidoligase family protein [Lachnospiraceae bacterium]|nr:ATP-grasp fold amidoligase family protein [Lachnospiraceae bacterium]
MWDNPDEIDFDALPNQFVLKCNHNSGLGMCICKDKSKLDISKVKVELRKGLKQDYYLTGREWPYKDVPRKIIAEKYMEDVSGV